MSLVLESSVNPVESIADKIRMEIMSLELEPGTRLQPLRELAIRYGTSYITIRKAVNMLCDEGLLYSRRGAGVYVSGDSDEEDKLNVKNRTLTMLFCGMEQHVTTTPIYSRVLYGIEKEAEENGFDVVISMMKRTEDFVKTDTFNNSAGFLALGDDLGGMKNAFSGKPFVWVMGADKKWGDHISYNNKSIGEMSASTLAARGHKHVAYVNVDPLVGRQRCESFKYYAELSGLSVEPYDDPSALLTSKFEQHVNQGIMDKWVEQILRSKPMPTGIFVVDMAAFSLYSSLVDKGLKPGEDVEIITCNSRDVPAFRRNYCPLNIEIHAEEIGSMAVRHLDWRLSHPQGKRIVMKIEPNFDT
jgi:DNA-binding LacI/PurR family transcriptional regulator